jgi:hypothetical protein
LESGEVVVEVDKVHIRRQGQVEIGVLEVEQVAGGVGGSIVSTIAGKSSSLNLRRDAVTSALIKIKELVRISAPDSEVAGIVVLERVFLGGNNVQALETEARHEFKKLLLLLRRSVN